jgi:nucleoside-diphosphate-sugar epimerase
MGPGTAIRDFLYVEDVAAAFIAALLSDYQGAFNIGSGEPVSLRSIGELLARLTGRQDLLTIGALPPVANEAPLIGADVSALRDEMDFSPRWTLETGLEATIDWWRAAPDDK